MIVLLLLLDLAVSCAHFNKLRYDLARRVPRIFPNPMGLLYFTGSCEIPGTIGMVVPQTRTLGGLGLSVFLLAILAANIKAAGEGVAMAGGKPRPNGFGFRCKCFSLCYSPGSRNPGVCGDKRSAFWQNSPTLCVGGGDHE